ncbi:MAG: ABC transporter ATP-binding protein [Candidatus Heimdallarchaeota archaeon]|nr:ABC transporter ATP-binding protein [Candidatus Heimdallarchaeota archaeon]MDH5645407.1 ABC transporter ATP-binding protein [Candidatus Heimdallarchaeota archaeon]
MSIEELDDELELEEKERVISDTPILRIIDLTKKFGELIAVNKATFDVYQGEILGIIGPNGSGKTTLFNMISGVLKPEEGEILTKKNENIVGKSTTKIVKKHKIARTFQIVRPFKLLQALDNVTIPHIPKGLQSPKTLKTRSLTSLLEVDMGEKKNYPAAILPHGDLKRLDFARALATDAEVLLLDEPYSGLSVEDSFRITQLIKNANQEKGVTIMIVEHKLKLLANLVDRIVVLNQGKIIAIGTPEEISKNQVVIESYLGKEASSIVSS